MLILGIDPGLATTGYGLIQLTSQNDYKYITYGIISTANGQPDSQRLIVVYAALKDLIEYHKPDVAAVEKLFFQKNVKTALSVGQARGVVLLALAQAGLEVYEYTPNEVKQTVSGYGNASKSQVQHMVQALLRLEELPKPDDAADALAVAICHSHHQGLIDRLRQSPAS